MPDFSLTDSLGNPADLSKVNWTSASSLFTYAKSESLHLIVAPDFIARKDKLLTAAAPEPVTFGLSVQHDFQIGGTAPEVSITPDAAVALSVNATPGSGLFDDDAFHAPCQVPAGTAYVGLSVTGSLDLGVSGTSGDLSFGIDKSGGITFGFMKAFPTGPHEPALGAAAAAMLAGFVIPAGIVDLSRLAVNDVCCVSGLGSLQVSGGVSIAIPVNPLASVNLPLGATTLAVKDGAMAGLTASFTLTGSYQIRLQRLTGGAIQLSYLRERGTVFQTDLSASAGVSVDLGTTDLLAKLLGGIEKGSVDPKQLDALTPDEIGAFTQALKAGIDHSLQASIDLALSTQTDGQAAFQYEIQPDLLSAESSRAVARALKGDLSLLTALEEGAGSDGAMAPGIKLLNSVFSTARTKGASLKINLLGIVNLISVSNLISNCEFLFEPASGELTIKETAQSQKIGAITDPLKKQEALRKALYYSVLATTTYAVGKAVTMPDFNCQAVHFALNRNADKHTIADYTNWFVALNLMTPDERTGILSRFGEGGPSTCTVRTRLNDALSQALFFDGQGRPRPRSDYLEIGRQALKALIDPDNSDIDRNRYRFLDDSAIWQQAVKIGPGPQLGTLIPLSSSDSQFKMVLDLITGDLSDIVWWADAMSKAGQALQQMRAFLSGRDPASLAQDPAFAARRNDLQKLMLDMVKADKLRFSEPWGLVCLAQAAGARGSSGSLTAPGLIMVRTGSIEAVTAARQ